MAQLTVDLTGLMEAGVGSSGIREQELDAVAERASAAVDTTEALRREGKVGFLDLPDDAPTARACMDYARDLPAEVDTMVVLGIGGSSLGPQAVYNALATPYDALRERSPGMPRRLFFPDNPDPVSFGGLLELLDPARTVFNVVTKSGGTAETAAQLMVVHQHLVSALGAERAAKHLVATTDPEAGALRRVSRQLGLAAFDIPPSVGGRFSVLTPVGLLPCAAAGIDVQGVLDGARWMRDRVLERDVRKNPALLLASLLHLHHTGRGRPIVVMMPYADALSSLGDWFRQLWAESLGKALDTEGNQVHVGSTPVVSRGATDQHSQLQLYAEGPDDKIFLFVSPKERGVEVEIPRGVLAEAPEYGYLAGRGLGELLDAELRGTRMSLARRGRPTAGIELARVDAPAVGAFLMLFEAVTAFAGPLFGVDPFDQPGVEEAKRLAYAALGRTGYDEEARLLADAPKPDPTYVL